MDADLIIALELQEQFDREFAKNINDSPQNAVDFSVGCNTASKPLSIIDESWELTDPSPDIRALFLQYNDRFFWGKLAGVEVRWSPRMTLCAGVCCYEGRGGLCSVRLSKPLLQLRPRKDLVETLLHEMIHALLFVTQNNKDHDGHGPEFQKHMNRINNETGTKISIYHNFHDEVAYFQQHWWRCDGPCQKRKPYFGYVKRAMNRAPSPRDFWWGEHQRSCGGTYTKIKEPEGYGQKKKGKSKTEKDEKSDIKAEKPKGGNMDIRLFTGSGFVLGAGKLKTESVTKPNTSASGSKKLPSSTVTRIDSDSEPDLPSLDSFLKKGNSNSNVVGKGGAVLNKKNNDESKRNSNSNTNTSSGIKKNMKTAETSNGAKQKSNTSSTISDAKKPGLNTSKTSTVDSFRTNTAVKQKSPSFKKGIFTIGNVDKSEDNESKTAPTAEVFSGSGRTLGTSNSQGGKGVLALLRKKWEKERASKNGRESKNTNKLIPPSNINHRKRNSDEFQINNDFDFKKIKIGKDEKNRKKNEGTFLNTVTNKNGSKDISSNLASMASSHNSSDGDVVVLGQSDKESKNLHTCPVCSTLIEFTLINQHLDRCLSE